MQVTGISWGADLSDYPDEFAHAPSLGNGTFADVDFEGWETKTIEGIITLVYTDIVVQPSCILALMSLPELQHVRPMPFVAPPAWWHGVARGAQRPAQGVPRCHRTADGV